MPDPTAPVIVATFCSALGIFAGTAVVRGVLGGFAPAPALPPPLPQEVVLESVETGSPFQAPLHVESTPPPPRRGVPVDFYRPLDLLGLGMIFLVYFGLVVSSVKASGNPDAALSPGVLLVSIGFQYISAAIVIALVVGRVGPVRWLGLRWAGWYWVFLIAPLTVVAMWLLFGGLQVSGYMEWIESLGVKTVQDTVKLLQDSTDPLTIGLMAFAAMIAAPMCEEIVFRGYLYSAGKRFAGPWVAGLCSALVFAAAHGSVSALLPLFIFGCVLAFLYEKTGSLWAPMSVHFCFNSATVLLQLLARHYNIPLESGT